MLAPAMTESATISHVGHSPLRRFTSIPSIFLSRVRQF